MLHSMTFRVRIYADVENDVYTFVRFADTAENTCLDGCPHCAHRNAGGMAIVSTPASYCGPWWQTIDQPAADSDWKATPF